ncbi:MAG: endopeptidase La [Bacteroidota bacterium]|nr:endopeptidase La [Bacteroidota bacterium]
MKFNKNKPYDNLLSSSKDSENLIPILPDSDSIELNEENLPEKLPIIPLRNSVLFPGVVIPIALGRESSMKIVEESYETNKLIGLHTQRNASTEKPGPEDVYQVGTIGHIIKILELPDGGKTALIKGMERILSSEIAEENNELSATEYDILYDIEPELNDAEFEGIIYSVKELSIKIIQLSTNIPDEAVFAVKNITDPAFLINFVATNGDLSAEQKQELIEAEEIKKRGEILISYLSDEIQKLELKNDIQTKVRSDMSKQQKEYFLNQQIKKIQEELGEEGPSAEIEELEKLGKKVNWTKEAEEAFKKTIKRIKQINPMSPDYSVQLNYLQTLTELPWNTFTEDNFDLKNAQKILDDDHYGLEKVKERIIEHLAVLKMKGDLKAPIICLYGPPGVGKTSLGKSVASALNRKYARMSLGGLHDEAEIRGHRKTYIGAMPGRIVQNLKKVKTSNPVFILDEIDKVGNDFRGDPSSALLEVLDPEQNKSFYDNFLELEYDLSKILFIATANNLNTINPALRDRMELIDVSGYITEEKIQIAKRHLIPKQIKEHGLKKSQLQINKSGVEEIITKYTRESGVRALDKRIAEVSRKIAKKLALEEDYSPKLGKKAIAELLGTPIHSRQEYEGNEFAGVVTGLAWTSVGGTILFIETSLSKGSGKLSLTGNLGDVMKESAIIAKEYLKANCKKYGIDNRLFSQYNIHIHVPQGAVPKDGPSAGITMLTALTSAYTQRKVKKNLAMTGELALRGKVLPVGGIKEKILAAKRAGIKEIILSEENRKDVNDIKDIYVKGLSFHYTETLDEVLDTALLTQKVKNAKQFELEDS